MDAYIAIIHAKPGQLLLGGVKRVESTPFETDDMAQDYIFAMASPPNYGRSEIVQVSVPRYKVILEKHCK